MAGWQRGVSCSVRCWWGLSTGFRLPLIFLLLSIPLAGVGAVDSAPALLEFGPASDAHAVPLDAAVTLRFSEPVVVAGDALRVVCERSGDHAGTFSGSVDRFVFTFAVPFQPAEWCNVTLSALGVSDADGEDPPDHLNADILWRFRAAAAPVPINELDVVSVDGAVEFIELYDGGWGNTDLRGLVLVLYRGTGGVYLAYALDGYHTDNRGYFVVGTRATPGADLVMADGMLRDGEGAVALFDAPLKSFPIGAPPSTVGIVAAAVYGPAGPGLTVLLDAGQAALDENGRGTATTDSLQRCPNGAGGLRSTTPFILGAPTPDAANACRPPDAAPAVSQTIPADGATRVALNALIEVTFNETVELAATPLEIACPTGIQPYMLEGSGQVYRFRPHSPLPGGSDCVATIFANRVTDLDENDPPDSMTADFVWRFTTAVQPPDGVMINEVDADTPGTDTAEFIELYDGGRGGIPLDGLAIVLFNGADDRSYRAIDLAGNTTDAHGYFLLAGSGVPGADIRLPVAVQNGPDAVALVAGAAADFPNGSPIVAPRDAIVYGPAAGPDAGLLPLLNAGQSQVDEAARGLPESHSNQRCPNGTGGLRNTATYRPSPPTPRSANTCTVDSAPSVIGFTPQDGATDVAPDATLTVQLSEQVALADGWPRVVCTASGEHALNRKGGPEVFQLTPALPFIEGETCQVTLGAAAVSDLDPDDPPDNPAANFTSDFQIAAPIADFMLINELDADTPGADTAEFIELYDGGVGNTSLNGLTLVFYNGGDDRVYRALPLEKARTDEHGYVVVGNNGVPGVDVVFPNAGLQNGADAVALFAGSATSFPIGAPLTTQGLVDAVVYGTADPPDAGLLALLLAGQLQVDEAGRGLAASHAVQRCPNGAGGQRITSTFYPNSPTPGAANDCAIDAPPSVANVTPPDGATGVATDARVNVRFSEDVTPGAGWFTIGCETSGNHAATMSGGPRNFTLTVTNAFAGDEACTVTIHAAFVHDSDTVDPPDTMAEDYEWGFRTVAPPIPQGIVINELDTDLPGADTAEFVELYDGGVGNTLLTGLVVVFWNGGDDRAYRVLDLAGKQTDALGYFLLGNTGLNPGLTFPNGGLQNGPDAVALYAGRAADFPTGTALTTEGLIDAVVYGPSGSPDLGLLSLLEAGQPQADEASGGAPGVHSLGRCPNGAGGPRRTDTLRTVAPTPRAGNNCVTDEPPRIAAVSPPPDATGVSLLTRLVITLSEPVALDEGWFRLTCDSAGSRPVTWSTGDTIVTMTPIEPLPPGDICEAAVTATKVHDSDPADPPDTLSADYSWRFRTENPTALKAAFISDSPVWIGDLMQFSNTSTGPSPLSFSWDFGDGSPNVTEVHAAHRYVAPGTYTVTLIARHGEATAEARMTVEVLWRVVHAPVVLR